MYKLRDFSMSTYSKVGEAIKKNEDDFKVDQLRSLSRKKFLWLYYQPSERPEAGDRNIVVEFNKAVETFDYRGRKVLYVNPDTLTPVCHKKACLVNLGPVLYEIPQLMYYRDKHLNPAKIESLAAFY